jgi:hypothetical protein
MIACNGWSCDSIRGVMLKEGGLKECRDIKEKRKRMKQ